MFTLTFGPVLHRVSTLTPTPLLLSSLVDMLEAGLTHLCLVWSNSHCGVVTTLTLVSLVLWVFTMTSTPLQLSWLVDWHGVGLLSLCFGWWWTQGQLGSLCLVWWWFIYPITLSIGKGGEITMRAGTLADDFPNDMRWDHQELRKRNCWCKCCRHAYQSINMFNFQHQHHTEHSTNKEYTMLEKGVYWRNYLILCIPL